MAKILYITPFFNFPPKDGASYRSVYLFEKLCEKHDVVLLTYPNKGLEPYPGQINGKIRIHELPFKRKSNKIHSFFKRLISAELPGFATHDINTISENIDNLILEYGQFDIHYFATQLMGQIVLKKKYPGLNIIDLYDIYVEHRVGKISDVPIWKPFHWLFRLEAFRVKNYERKILKHFDHILVTCEEESKIINELVYKASIFKLPNGIIYPKKINKTSQTGNILMVGNFEHSPNMEGILWFYNKVWKMVKKRYEDSKLILVGKMPESLKKTFSNDEDIKVEGLVPDLGPYYEQASCVIIPIFHLSGIKIKLLEAMAYGIPIVSTQTGGMGFEDIPTIKFADTPESFAYAIEKILINNIVTGDEIEETRKMIYKGYTWDKIGNDLNDIICSLEKTRSSSV